MLAVTGWDQACRSRAGQWWNHGSGMGKEFEAKKTPRILGEAKKDQDDGLRWTGLGSIMVAALNEGLARLVAES